MRYFLGPGPSMTPKKKQEVKPKENKYENLLKDADIDTSLDEDDDFAEDKKTKKKSKKKDDKEKEDEKEKEKENPEAKNFVRMSICVDLRKLLDAPLAHQSLVSGIIFDYDESFANLNIEDQIKKIRQEVSESIKEPKSLFYISSSYYYLMMLSKEKDINKARQIATANKESTGGFVSGVISYVGKANFGESEKYITDFRTTTDNPSALLVEIAAVNGKFYLDFIQNFKDERYFNAFKKELEDLWNPFAEEFYKSSAMAQQMDGNPFSGFTGQSNPFAQ